MVKVDRVFKKYRQTDRQKDRQTDRQTTDRQTNSQTDAYACIHPYMQEFLR